MYVSLDLTASEVTEEEKMQRGFWMLCLCSLL